MSDYLWDKSGDPDLTVERLEELLGSRGYEREPLRLPPEAAVGVTRRSYAPAFHTRSAAAAAVAAGLVLAVLGGVWLGKLRNDTAVERDVTAANNSRMTMRRGQVPDALFTSGESVSHSQIQVEVEDPMKDTRSSRLRHKLRAMPGITEEKPRVQVERTKRESSAQTGIARATIETARARSTIVRSSGGSDDDAKTHRDADEQLDAKEQLMFALRLTSTKLSVARARTQVAPVSEADAKSK